MGCCGCGLYGSTVTAGVLGIIQSVIYFMISVAVTVIHYTLSRSYERYSSEGKEDPERFNVDFLAFLRINTAVKTMIVVILLFNLIWFASSIALLVSNVKRKPNANGVYQWVIITSVMTVCEMLLSFYLISIAADNVGGGYPSIYSAEFFLDLAATSRGYGVVFGWSFNIPLTVFVYKRYQEIRKMKLANGTSPDTVTHNLQPEGQAFPYNQIQMQQRPYSMASVDSTTQPHHWTTGHDNPQYPTLYPKASHDPHDVGLNGQHALERQ